MTAFPAALFSTFIIFLFSQEWDWQTMILYRPSVYYNIIMCGGYKKFKSRCYSTYVCIVKSNSVTHNKICDTSILIIVIKVNVSSLIYWIKLYISQQFSDVHAFLTQHYFKVEPFYNNSISYTSRSAIWIVLSEK